MSKKQFEHFLIERLVSWLSSEHQLQAGSRLQFKSPNAENTLKLMLALSSLSDGAIEYKGRSHPYVSVGKLRLLFAGHMETYDVEHGCYSENYISMLRDEIAGQSDGLVGTALLVIHNSLLDTLINSAYDLSKEGAVWSPTSIKGHLETLIDENGEFFTVSKCLLEHQSRFVELDGSSMFGFRELYEAMVDDGDLRFDELGLFADEIMLRNNDEQYVENRLNQNRVWRERIENTVEHFPNEIEDRLPEFGTRFIGDHFGNNPSKSWTNLDFSEILGELKKQKEQELEFVGIDPDFFANIVWRNQSDAAAGRRKKNLLITVPVDQNELEFKIRYEGKKLEASDLKVVPQRLEDQISISHRSSGDKSTYHVKCSVQDTPLYFSLQLERDKSNEKYTFLCLLLREGLLNLGEIENFFLIDSSKKVIVLEASEHVLQLGPVEGGTHVLQDSGEVINLNDTSTVDFRQIYDDADDVRFVVERDDVRVDFRIAGEARKSHLILPQIFDTDRYTRLYSSDISNGVYKPGKETVVVDNQESEPIFIRKELLKIEHDFVEGKLVSKNYDISSSVTIQDLSEYGFNELAIAYQSLFAYLGDHKTLPSLCSWGPTFTGCVTAIQDAYLDILRQVPKDHTLNLAQRDLMKVGFVEVGGRKYISPYHPLVLSYFLHLVENIRDDGDYKSFRDLPQVTRSRLNPRGLIPFVFDPVWEYGYSHIVEENPMWLEIIPQEESTFDFVQNLVRDKVGEFVKTFGHLFAQVQDAPLIINSVNNGKNAELFQGLINYFRQSLDRSRSVHVNLYDDELCETEFDEFAELGSYEEIKSRYRLDKGKLKENADTIIDLLRTKLTFSKYEHEVVEEQKYSHLTFFKNNQKIKRVGNDITSHPSGVACSGLLNGETSVSENDQYFTAFGMENIDISSLPHLEIAGLVGSLLWPAESPTENYHQHSAVRLAVSGDFRNLLERSYDSSLWTTIIDPKVTLSFFESSKGVLLIHYSDQYTSSSGYDAITVTKQADLYRSVLKDEGSNLINEFNAFNGEWLLKLVTDPIKEKKAKRGIVGGYKVVSSLLSHSDITWIPLSVAEMIRVAGNIGLAMADSDFSRHNLQIKKGAISDDILFAGFKNNCLYLLPVEVKTGARPDFSKARTQALELKKFMEEGLLKGKSLKSRLFRGLFVRQILLQVEKYELYDVFDDGYFDELINSQGEWLKGEYEISQLPEYPKGIVVAHISNALEENYNVQEDVLQIELPIGYLDDFVKTSHRDLQKLIADKNRLNLDDEYFLKPFKFSHPHQTFDQDMQLEEADNKEPLVNDNKLEVATEVDVQIEASNQGENEPLKIKFGFNVVNDDPIYWEPTNTETLFNMNTGIIGTMGTGKTQFTKSVITQLYRNQQSNVGGQPIGVLIFDYKADYVKDDFVSATNAKVFELHQLPFNPFALFGNRPMQPVHTANLFRTTLAQAFGLGVKQQNKIRTLVMEAYEAAGINAQDQSTWSRPVPTLQDIWSLFQEGEKVEQDSLYAALDDLISFEIFESDGSKTTSLYDLVDGVTVINLSGYDTQIQNLVVALTLDLFYIQMQQRGSSRRDGDFRQINKLVLVDEADNFMSQDFESLKKILKEGREFGVGTILSTQELTHFKTGENDYSSLILTWVIHQVANFKNQEIRSIFNTQSKQDEEVYMSSIRLLEKHHSLHVDGKKKITKIRDLAFWEIA
jgi:DNA phosphorothioation-dependent restriction protein DptH